MEAIFFFSGPSPHIISAKCSFLAELIARTRHSMCLRVGISPTVRITTRPFADLVVSSVNAPAAGSSGQPLNLSWTVTNQGQGTTDVSSWRDQVVLSSDTVLGNADDVSLGSFTRTGIGTIVDMEGVAVSGGSACASGSTKASHVREALYGDDDPFATVRFSFGKDTQEKDLERAVEAMVTLGGRSRQV